MPERSAGTLRLSSLHGETQIVGRFATAGATRAGSSPLQDQSI